MFQVSFYFIPFHSYLMLMGLIDSDSVFNEVYVFFVEPIQRPHITTSLERWFGN